MEGGYGGTGGGGGGGDSQTEKDAAAEGARQEQPGPMQGPVLDEKSHVDAAMCSLFCVQGRPCQMRLAGDTSPLIKCKTSKPNHLSKHLF